MNNEQCDDSNFQKEGDYILNKMPKYKYDIKIIHDYRHKKEKEKAPSKIVSSERFTILNKPKNTLKKITLQKNYKNHNNEDFNQMYKRKSPRMGTISFYPQELCLQDDNIENTSYQKLYNNKGIYYQNYENYITNNNEIVNDYRNDKNNDDMDFHYDNNNCNNMDYYDENEIVHENYNNDNFRNNNYNSNYFSKNLDYNNNYENENGSYIIDIFPNRPCICQREIDKIINDYYFNNKKIHKNNIFGCNRVCRCGLNICDRNNMTVINDSAGMINNKYNYYNYCSPPRSMRNKYPKVVDRSMKKLQYPKYKNKYSNYMSRSPNYKRPSYYFIKGNKFNDKQNNIIYNMNNYSNMDNYNNYIDISNLSNKSKLKKEILTKKIKISSKIDKIPQNEISNNSFISVDNIRNKNLMVNNSPYIKRIKNDKITYNNITKYEPKDPNLNDNLNRTNISIGRRSNNNIMICKSSEKKEKIKVFPLGKKIYPLIVKKSVEKPKKEIIINKDGTTTNVIKQTSVVTSIESKPIQSKNNLKNETYVKENITKIYTTLTKDDITDNINNNHIINSNNIKIDKDKEKLNDDNLNYSNYNKNKVNDRIIDLSFEDIKDINNEIDNDFLNINKFSNNFNNNSEISNSSLNYNTYEQSDFNNPSKINKHFNYIKYLYNKCNNSNFIDGNKEESLSSYFLKFNDEEKKEILNGFKDGNIEDKKIYNKLMKILKVSIISEVKNNFGDDENA